MTDACATVAIGTAPNLLSHHQAELRASGISDETLAKGGIYSEMNIDVLRSLLNQPKLPAKVGSGLIYRFRDKTGHLNGFVRVKLDNPRKDRNSKPIKYETPKGEAPRAYFPAGTCQFLESATVEILITEGEKKAICADQHGFPCIGLGGVHGWNRKKSSQLIPDLEMMAWNGRPVILVFDSDQHQNPQVQEAQSKFAAALQKRGAKVLVAQLPDGPPDPDGKPTKMGLDDFLVAHGPAKLRELLDAADPPDPIDSGFERIEAGGLDATTFALEMLDKSAHVEEKEKFYTVRFYRGEYYYWEASQGRYEPQSSAWMSSRVWRFLHVNFSHITQSVVSNMLAAMRAMCIVSGSTKPASTDC